MKILDLFESYLFEKTVKAKFDTVHYGNWTMDMSTMPVKMPALTGDTAMYVARATHKRKGTQIFGKGQSQAEAREDAFAKINDTDRTADPDAFKGFTLDLNVDFTREYMDDKTGNYFKMGKDDSGAPVLIMASKAYFANFGKEMEDLGFRKARPRTPPGPNAVPVYSLPFSKAAVKALGLIPNMRYTLDYAKDDADGNALFSLSADTRTAGPQDKYQMRRPGMTLAASLAEDSNQLKGTDVAKTVKPQPFAGSQPHPFQGMLVGDETGEAENPTDKITMDVPLFLRMMEYAKEDAKTDMDLHDVTERAIKLMQGHDWLCMENYDELVGGQATGGEQTMEAKKKPKPTSPEKWAQAKAKARSKFEVYPSAYANAWAAKEYKRMGGGWRMG